MSSPKSNVLFVWMNSFLLSYKSNLVFFIKALKSPNILSPKLWKITLDSNKVIACQSIILKNKIQTHPSAKYFPNINHSIKKNNNNQNHQAKTRQSQFKNKKSIHTLLCKQESIKCTHKEIFANNTNKRNGRIIL